METYILVSFWMMIIGFVLKILITAFSTHPREQTYSIGLDVADAIIKIPFFLWAAYLLWA
jgi:hypothetical protein